MNDRERDYDTKWLQMHDFVEDLGGAIKLLGDGRISAIFCVDEFRFDLVDPIDPTKK